MVRKYTDWINVAAGAGLGAYFLLLSLFRPEALRNLSAALADHGAWLFLCFVAGLVLLGANVYLLVRARRVGGLRESLRLCAPDGANLFAPEALEALFLRSLKEQDDLRHPKVALEVRSGQGVALHLRFGLREQPDVVRRLEQIKALVRDQFLRMLPSGVALEIYVEVVDFVVDEQAAAARRTGAPAAPAVGEFNGPVYSDAETHDEA